MSGLPVNTKYELSDLIPVGIAFAVVIIDQLTKLWIMTAFALHEQQTIIPGFFDLVYVTNTGAAFG
ncbi:MAG: signal peptidase II, partial [Desulfobulbales bacterium]